MWKQGCFYAGSQGASAYFAGLWQNSQRAALQSPESAVCLQARSAPVQRLADEVAGKFAVGVLALSAATFTFWAMAGPRLFPQVCCHLGNSSRHLGVWRMAKCPYKRVLSP